MARHPPLFVFVRIFVLYPHYSFGMPRKLRFAPPGYFLHITQRGNYRQRTFFSEQDYTTFLDLLVHYSESLTIDILAYCLMPNHFHLMAQAHQPGDLSRFMQCVNGRYAQYLHGRLTRRGRLWQERFYSCITQDSYILTALRYVELNPVRARLAENAVDYRWSSAAAHAEHRQGRTPRLDWWLDLESFDRVHREQDWRCVLQGGLSRREAASVRRATQNDGVLGTPEFMQALEAAYGVQLVRKPMDRSLSVGSSTAATAVA